MPNLMKTHYQEVKRELTQLAHDVEALEEGVTHTLALMITEAVKSFTDGFTGMLDNCQRYYEDKNRNKGNELKAEARKAVETGQKYLHRIQQLAHDRDIAALNRYRQAASKMNTIVLHLIEYRDKGLTVQHNYFQHD